MRGFFAFWWGAKQSWASLAYCVSNICWRKVEKPNDFQSRHSSN